MEYLTERNWNPRKLQYELGETWKIKVWPCKERMKLERESCKIEDIDLDEAYGMAIQITGGGRQSRRTIPASKMEMIDVTPKEMAEMLVEDAISRAS